MTDRNRRSVIVSRNELELAIRTRRQVYLTYRDSTGATQVATVVPMSLQRGADGDFLMFQRGSSTSAVALEEIEAFEFV